MDVAADTWGISGPDFLLLYAVLATGVILFRFIFIAILQSSATQTPHTPLTPYELAYLAGGSQRSILAAFTTLLHDGHLYRESRKRYIYRSSLSAEADPLERAIWKSVRNGESRPKRIHTALTVREQFEEMRRTLTARGYTMSPTKRRLTLLPFLLFLSVLGVGIARLTAGSNNDQPIVFLAITLIIFGVIGGMTTLKRPYVTQQGRHAVREAKRDHRYLQGTRLLKEPQRTLNSTERKIAIGVFGAVTLWSIDPMLAHDTGTSTPMGSSIAGGGDGGGGDGGGGGCGGGGGGCGG